MRAFPVLLPVLLAGGPLWGGGEQLVAEQKVDVDYDKAVDFTKYKTFAWVPFQEPLRNPANHIRMTRAVERELAARGLLKSDVAAAADVFVHYQGRIEKKIQSKSGPSESPWQATPDQQWKVSFDLKRAEIGTLVLELWDGRTKDVVWRARGSEMVRRPDQTEEQINEMVKKLLAVYPPKPETK